MPEQRVDRLEVAIAELTNKFSDLTNKFSEFLAIESARQERDRHQLELNKRLLDHMEKIDSEYIPIIKRSKKWQEWVDSFIGKFILPAVVLSILAAAGYSFS